MTVSTTQESRRDALAALLAADNSNIEDYDFECEEDLRPYFTDDPEPIGRFVCVTRNWSKCDGKLFYLPHYNDIRIAFARAEYHDRDDLFEEVPVKVVDLDNGIEYHAEPSYTWEIRA